MERHLITRWNAERSRIETVRIPAVPAVPATTKSEPDPAELIATATMFIEELRRHFGSLPERELPRGAMRKKAH